MRKRANTLINEIEKEALDASVPVSSPLRKLVALGGQARSNICGSGLGLSYRGYYGTHVELPDYRKPGAMLRIEREGLRAGGGGLG